MKWTYNAVLIIGGAKVFHSEPLETAWRARLWLKDMRERHQDEVDRYGFVAYYEIARKL
jgi:hypothetical protein